MPILTDEQYQEKVIKSAMTEILQQVPLQFEQFSTIEKYLNYVYEIGVHRAKQKGNPSRNQCIEQIYSGRVIDTFKSIADASRKVGISAEAIRKVLINENNTAAGYFWRYKKSI
jgi:hypothetical protein